MYDNCTGTEVVTRVRLSIVKLSFMYYYSCCTYLTKLGACLGYGMVMRVQCDRTSHGVEQAVLLSHVCSNVRESGIPVRLIHDSQPSRMPTARKQAQYSSSVAYLARLRTNLLYSHGQKSWRDGGGGGNSPRAGGLRQQIHLEDGRHGLWHVVPINLVPKEIAHVPRSDASPVLLYHHLPRLAHDEQRLNHRLL